MKRRILCLLFCILLLPAGSMGEAAVTFTDDMGQQLTLSNPQRVAVLSGSLAELWQLAGGTLTCVTQDALDERGLTLPDDIVNVGSLKQPNAELLMASDLDLVILTPTLDGQTDLGKQLAESGIQTAYFDLETFDDYLRILKLFSEMTGHPDKFDTYGTAISSQVQAALDKAAGKPSPTVLLIRAYGTGVKAKRSDDTVASAILHDLGCTNIADSDDTLLEELSLERILITDPDFIFVTTMGADDEALAALAKALTDNPAWSGLTAVREGRFIVLPKELFHYKPNARWGESYEILANLLYGE